MSEWFTLVLSVYLIQSHIQYGNGGASVPQNTGGVPSGSINYLVGGQERGTRSRTHREKSEQLLQLYLGLGLPTTAQPF